MTDHNSMKADEYAERQGEMDELDNAIDVMELIVSNEMYEKAWFECLPMNEFRTVTRAEAKRRVMLAIKERSEP